MDSEVTIKIKVSSIKFTINTNYEGKVKLLVEEEQLEKMLIMPKYVTCIVE